MQIDKGKVGKGEVDSIKLSQESDSFSAHAAWLCVSVASGQSFRETVLVQVRGQARQQMGGFAALHTLSQILIMTEHTKCIILMLVHKALVLHHVHMLLNPQRWEEKHDYEHSCASAAKAGSMFIQLRNYCPVGVKADFLTP
jgi:hypothetical protein